MNIMVIIFLCANFILLLLSFIIIMFDILKASSNQLKDEKKYGKTLVKQITINKRGYLFGILSLICMVFLSLNYIR